MTASDAYVAVTCDGQGCAENEEIQLTATAHGWDDRYLKSALHKLGWTLDGDNHYCQDCARELAETGEKRNG